MTDPFSDDATATTDFFGTATGPSPSPSEALFLDQQPDRHAQVAELADFYRHLAESEFAGYCDLYAQLARSIAADDEMLELVAAMAPATKIIPILLFAAVHDAVLRDPTLPLAAFYQGAPGDPWPAFREHVIAHHDALRTVVRERTIQTNEVGRSAMLWPAIAAVHHLFDRPLAIIELGPSAGLNLGFDRFGYEYFFAPPESAPSPPPPRRVGVTGSPVQLRCEVRGELVPPLDATAPPVVSRLGIDINPVDVLDDDACRWLEACIWPMIPHRAERFRAAVALARTDPPVLHRGDVFELLPTLIDDVPATTVPVVTSTWVLAYFSKDQRVALADLLDTIGATRDLASVTAEYPGVTPWIPRPGRDAHDPSGQAATAVGLLTWQAGVRRARPLAWTHAHGRWIDWLDAESAERAETAGETGGS